jgi:hypothetical protein
VNDHSGLVGLARPDVVLPQILFILIYLYRDQLETQTKGRDEIGIRVSPTLFAGDIYVLHPSLPPRRCSVRLLINLDERLSRRYRCDYGVL